MSVQLPRADARARLRACVAATTLILASPALAWAEEPPKAEGPRTFLPADFKSFAPRTALDMLRQVPGFVVVEATQERGLGQASGNVLINGQRISAKSSNAVAELDRVPIQNVVRIELLDAASLNIAGLAGRVANVVVEASAISGQFLWNPEFRAYYTTPNLARGEVSISGGLGPVQYTLGVQNRANRSAAGGLTRIYAGDGTLIEIRDEVWRYDGEQPRLSGRLTYDGPSELSGALGFFYEQLFSGRLEKGVRGPPGQVDRYRRLTQDTDNHSFEVNGELEFSLGPGRLKLIGLGRVKHDPPINELVTLFVDGSPSLGERVDRIGDEREQVARGEYRWTLAGEWQISAERTFNSLDLTTRLFALNGGAVREVPIPAGSGRVEENRYEAMVSYGRRLTPNLDLQVSVGVEHSHFVQTGAIGLDRTFWRPKGLVTAAWKPAEGLDVNLKVERRVGQLLFYDFLASVNLTEERRNVGNPDLVPQQSWNAEVEVIRGMGALGVSRLRVYGRMIDDIVDIVPIGPNGESWGNIDRAKAFGLAWNGTFELAAMGIAGAKVDARLEYETSSLRDPLTGRPRPISKNLIQFASLNLRHDVPRTQWAWGFEGSHRFAAPDFRLGEVGRLWEGPIWLYAYVERKEVRGLTIRAAVSNAALAREYWNRTVYVGRRTGPVAYVERRNRNIGPIFNLQVRGRF